MTSAPHVVPAYPLADGVLLWAVVAIGVLVVVLALRPRRRVEDITPPPDLVPRDQLDDALADNSELRRQLRAAHQATDLALRARRPTL